MLCKTSTVWSLLQYNFFSIIFYIIKVSKLDPWYRINLHLNEFFGKIHGNYIEDYWEYFLKCCNKIKSISLWIFCLNSVEMETIRKISIRIILNKFHKKSSTTSIKNLLNATGKRSSLKFIKNYFHFKLITSDP